MAKIATLIIVMIFFFTACEKNESIETHNEKSGVIQNVEPTRFNVWIDSSSNNQRNSIASANPGYTWAPCSQCCRPILTNSIDTFVDSSGRNMIKVNIKVRNISTQPIHQVRLVGFSFLYDFPSMYIGNKYGVVQKNPSSFPGVGAYLGAGHTMNVTFEFEFDAFAAANNAVFVPLHLHCTYLQPYSCGTRWPIVRTSATW